MKTNFRVHCANSFDIALLFSHSIEYFPHFCWTKFNLTYFSLTQILKQGLTLIFTPGSSRIPHLCACIMNIIQIIVTPKPHTALSLFSFFCFWPVYPVFFHIPLIQCSSFLACSKRIVFFLRRRRRRSQWFWALFEKVTVEANDFGQF